MDTSIEQYSTIIIDWLSEYADNVNRQYPDTYDVVVDRKHHHYQVVGTYWKDDVFKLTIIFYLQIKPNGKVWLLVNNTDLLVFDELMERGIPKTDLVIGFLPESLRQYSGYAVA